MSAHLRNFGLVAHVDAGKTTVAEQLLLAAGRLHVAGEVKGARPTHLDHLAVEVAHGITVTAAATHLGWGEHALVLVDTPGHIDFTVEVERAMAVLDGAVLVLCGVAGVQSQTRTVEAQMARYGVPRIAFVNKLDHPAADPAAAVAGLRERLGLNAALVALPLGQGPEARRRRRRGAPQGAPRRRRRRGAGVDRRRNRGRPRGPRRRRVPGGRGAARGRAGRPRRRGDPVGGDRPRRAGADVRPGARRLGGARRRHRAPARRRRRLAARARRAAPCSPPIR
ncbi:MAG: GTP-binding protein [Myxococcota bacterium]